MSILYAYATGKLPITITVGNKHQLKYSREYFPSFISTSYFFRTPYLYRKTVDDKEKMGRG